MKAETPTPTGRAQPPVHAFALIHAAPVLGRCLTPPTSQPNLLPANHTAPQKKEEDCIPEKLFMAACLSICINTLVLGLRQVFVLKTVTGWLALPCLWCGSIA